ncbi:hypothetical protein M3936_14320 [Sutcliffiella horikoshii]|uniref:hypothetical protein n=1 Tax=Sutcliffiella horikoshii TaxID=79883 RepID=UPI0020422D28|nr:hypothetical protein [Sutcliffiella horikoshii]MCM3618762.1 hypothetical protein [Sutcliffiella horikoshii]
MQMIKVELEPGDRVKNLENEVVGILRKEEKLYYVEGNHFYAGYWKTPLFTYEEISLVWVRF